MPSWLGSSPSSAASIWRSRSVSPRDPDDRVVVEERLGQAHDRVREQVRRERGAERPARMLGFDQSLHRGDHPRLHDAARSR